MTETAYQTIRAIPDDEPVEFPWHRCVYASWPWLTEEFMREMEDG